MDAAVSTVVPPTEGLNAPSSQAPDTVDTVNTLVSIKVNINNGQKFNADHVEMQDDWVNGQRPSQDPWPAIGASDRTRLEHLRSACPDWQTGTHCAHQCQPVQCIMTSIRVVVCQLTLLFSLEMVSRCSSCIRCMHLVAICTITKKVCRRSHHHHVAPIGQHWSSICTLLRPSYSVLEPSLFVVIVPI